MLSFSVMSDSFVTPRTVAHQAPLSTGFLRQEYWSNLPFPPPGDLPYSGMEPLSPVFPALADIFFTTEPPGKFPIEIYINSKITYVILLEREGRGKNEVNAVSCNWLKDADKGSFFYQSCNFSLLWYINNKGDIKLFLYLLKEWVSPRPTMTFPMFKVPHNCHDKNLNTSVQSASPATLSLSFLSLLASTLMA